MAKTALLLCLVLVVLSVNIVQCRRWFRSRPRGSSWGRSSSRHRSTSFAQPRPASTWGSGSSASRRHDGSSNTFSSGSRSPPVEFGYNYPSPINGLSGLGSSSFGVADKYPPSLSGLSGFGSVNKYPLSQSGLSGSDLSLFGSASKYPQSPSGLSGSGSSLFGLTGKYPQSTSGLSGSGFASPGLASRYPPSPSGLSGAGPANKYPPLPSGLSGAGLANKYPQSPSGLSGSGSASKYPTAPSGLPGSGSANQYPTAPSGLPGPGSANKYPPSPSGLSGSGPSGKYPTPPSGPSGSGTSSLLHKYPSSRSGLSGAEIQRSVIISVCWVAGAGVGFLPLFGWHAAVDSAPGCYFVEVMDYNYLLFLYFATIVTPSVLLAAFYAHIYRVVVKQMSAVVTVEGSQGRGGTMLRVLGAAQKREVKATQNLAIIVFFFIVCWIPLYTINAIKTFMPELDIPNTLTYFCIIFSHLNSAINPLLYAYHLKDFRAALKGLICTVFGRGVPLPAAYRPPVPIRRPALERCNALRERPKVYVHSPVWLRQREAEKAAREEQNMAASTSVPDMEPFLNRVAADGSSGRHTPEGRETTNGPYLIESNQDKCQSPYKKVEDFLRRVRSVSSEHS